MGRRLARRRRLLGLTQKQLGAAVGLRFQQIQKYECAGNAMLASCVWRLAEALDVPVSYFYDGFRCSDGMERESRGPLQAGRPVGEAADLIEAYYQLSPRPRHYLLQLTKSLSTAELGVRD